MSQFIKQTNTAAEPGQDDSEVIVLLKKMQQHLAFLEKKIDMLVERGQGASRPPFQRNFSRPPRKPEFGNSQGNRGREGFSRDRDRGFEKRSFDGPPRHSHRDSNRKPPFRSGPRKSF